MISGRLVSASTISPSRPWTLRMTCASASRSVPPTCGPRKSSRLRCRATNDTIGSGRAASADSTSLLSLAPSVFTNAWSADLGRQPQDQFVEEEHHRVVAERLGVPGDHREPGVEVEVLAAAHRAAEERGRQAR